MRGIAPARIYGKHTTNNPALHETEDVAYRRFGLGSVNTLRLRRSVRLVAEMRQRGLGDARRMFVIGIYLRKPFLTWEESTMTSSTSKPVPVKLDSDVRERIRRLAAGSLRRQRLCSSLLLRRKHRPDRRRAASARNRVLTEDAFRYRIMRRNGKKAPRSPRLRQTGR